MIKLIVSLGNIKKEYLNTRHNIGQRFTNYLFNPIFVEKLSSKYTNVIINNKKYHLIYPNSFINLSGKAVVQVSNFFKIKSDEILIISDDLESEFGTVEIKKGGGHKGHNGKRNIQELMGTNNFIYMKIGIGRPRGQSVSSFVLSRFYKDEEIALPLVFDMAKEMLYKYLEDYKDIKQKLP